MAIIITTTSAMQTDFAHFCLQMDVLRALNAGRSPWRDLGWTATSLRAPVCVCVCTTD